MTETVVATCLPFELGGFPGNQGLNKQACQFCLRTVRLILNVKQGSYGYRF